MFAHWQLICHEIVRFTAQDLRCKKYTNSGFRSRPLTTPSAAELQQPEVADPFELGGLRDDDLEESQPPIAEVKGPQASRKNEVFLASHLIGSLISILILPACEDRRENCGCLPR